MDRAALGKTIGRAEGRRSWFRLLACYLRRVGAGFKPAPYGQKGAWVELVTDDR